MTVIDYPYPRPRDQDEWLVFADHLVGEGDPWGERIVAGYSKRWVKKWQDPCSVGFLYPHEGKAQVPWAQVEDNHKPLLVAGEMNVDLAMLFLRVVFEGRASQQVGLPEDDIVMLGEVARAGPAVWYDVFRVRSQAAMLARIGSVASSYFPYRDVQRGDFFQRWDARLEERLDVLWAFLTGQD